MPEFVNGLPLHALLVHVVVVLVPLAVLGAIVIAVWPAARRRFGWLVLGFAVVDAIVVPLTTESGENLDRRVPSNPQLAEHERLGDMMIYWVVPLLVLIAALMALEVVRRRQLTTIDAGGPGTQTAATGQVASWLMPVSIVVAVLTVAVAVGTGIHCFRVGDAGAKSVWGFVQDQPAR
ncbi:DUF2231 domain-containing protein [Labedaea rhizosphaerae]|uniref:DUF2231 domain-containing protein n=1 Tax=Labedaea rhizosphaerae TaxID=598644 RepID=A0A4R6RW70_LABRH|nr:DUF2231 domain-containing protein [Labedaea rhizosphaerae]TDP91193.1 hypothetical protein EV186_109185 [Labedaea rhizosphaerae]